MHIMRKRIHLDRSELLCRATITSDSLRTDWRIYGGAWSIEDGWLTGKNPDNCPGMIIHRDDFPGNVMVDFEARTVLPCTHDIDFMWNGSWDEATDQRGLAYVGGLEGWWGGKVGIEKSPEYKLNALTPLFPFEPSRSYHIQGGSVGWPSSSRTRIPSIQRATLRSVSRRTAATSKSGTSKSGGWPGNRSKRATFLNSADLLRSVAQGGVLAGVSALPFEAGGSKKARTLTSTSLRLIGLVT
jgi:hypothetical protein